MPRPLNPRIKRIEKKDKEPYPRAVDDDPGINPDSEDSSTSSGDTLNSRDISKKELFGGVPPTEKQESESLKKYRESSKKKRNRAPIIAGLIIGIALAAGIVVTQVAKQMKETAEKGIKKKPSTQNERVHTVVDKKDATTTSTKPPSNQPQKTQPADPITNPATSVDPQLTPQTTPPAIQEPKSAINHNDSTNHKVEISGYVKAITPADTPHTVDLKSASYIAISVLDETDTEAINKWMSLKLVGTHNIISRDLNTLKYDIDTDVIQTNHQTTLKEDDGWRITIKVPEDYPSNTFSTELYISQKASFYTIFVYNNDKQDIPLSIKGKGIKRSISPKYTGPNSSVCLLKFEKTTPGDTYLVDILYDGSLDGSEDAHMTLEAICIKKN